MRVTEPGEKWKLLWNSVRFDVVLFSFLIWLILFWTTIKLSSETCSTQGANVFYWLKWRNLLELFFHTGICFVSYGVYFLEAVFTLRVISTQAKPRDERFITVNPKLMIYIHKFSCHGNKLYWSYDWNLPSIKKWKDVKETGKIRVCAVVPNKTHELHQCLLVYLTLTS